MTQTATIGQVKDDFDTILGWIANGDEVTVLRNETAVAKITPAKPKLPPLPDYMARMRRLGGNPVTAAGDCERARAYNAGEITEEELFEKSKPMPDYVARRKQLGGNDVTAEDWAKMRDYFAGAISEEELLGVAKP